LTIVWTLTSGGTSTVGAEGAGSEAGGLVSGVCGTVPAVVVEEDVGADGLVDVVVDGLGIVVVDASGVSALAATLGNVRPVNVRMTANDAAINRQNLRIIPPNRPMLR
jgi:hypothetical protein